MLLKDNRFSLREECGVMGVWEDPDAPGLVCRGLFEIQHRGQEGCGVAVVGPDNHISCIKGLGLVSEVFGPSLDPQFDFLSIDSSAQSAITDPAQPTGSNTNQSTATDPDTGINPAQSAEHQGRLLSAIGHVRYGTSGGGEVENVQPLVFHLRSGDFAIAHNGNIVNADALKRTLGEEGCIFSTSSDTEVIAHLLRRYQSKTSLHAVNNPVEDENTGLETVPSYADEPDSPGPGRSGGYPRASSPVMVELEETPRAGSPVMAEPEETPRSGSPVMAEPEETPRDCSPAPAEPESTSESDGSRDLSDAIAYAMRVLDGAISLLVLTPDAMYVTRDRYGFRPLSIGRLKSGAWAAASEDCALNALGATDIRDVQPGELIRISRSGSTVITCPAAPGLSLSAAATTDDPDDRCSSSVLAAAAASGGTANGCSGAVRFRPATPGRTAAPLVSTTYTTCTSRLMCAMEYIYFARPDSDIEGVNVHAFRRASGAILFEESPVEADMVIGVPDSGMSAAIGYAEASGLPLEFGLLKNAYSRRTFIQPSQSMRDLGVLMKLSPVSSVIRGKRLIVIDDSIVRGTTSLKIVRMLRRAGAAEVHMRITSPMITGPCFYGVDISSRSELLCAGRDLERARAAIEADSLAFISREGLLRAGKRSSLCTACFDGNYPTALYGNELGEVETKQ